MKKLIQFFNLVFFFSLLSSCIRNNTENLETKIKPNYDKIILLSYDKPRNDYDTNGIKFIDNKIKISKIKIIDSIVLNKFYAKKILTILCNPLKFGSMADCYNPRHILLFYNNSILIGYYEFCAECGGSRQSENIKIPMLCTENGIKLIKLFKEMNLKNTGENNEL